MKKNTLKLFLVFIGIFFSFNGAGLNIQEINKIIKFEKDDDRYSVTIRDAQHYKALKEMGEEKVEKKYTKVEGILDIDLIEKGESDIKVKISKINARNILMMYFNISEREVNSLKF